MITVLIVGGTGNFGGYVARKLAPDPRIRLVLSGRDAAKAQAMADKLDAANPATGVALDIAGPFPALEQVRPDLVINMVGPYHTQGYSLPRAAIACGANYCDIADSRCFVAGIGDLDGAAKAAGTFAIAGASSVPCLTAAYADETAEAMAEIHSIDCGISGAEQANRGVGTVAAVLSYVGNCFTRLKRGRMAPVTGWGSLHAVRFPELGLRWFGDGDVPDLALFPARYPTLRDHRFRAGHEIAVLHFGTWALSLLRRWRLLPPLDRLAPLLLKMSGLFNWMGNGRSGFYMIIRGVDAAGMPMERRHWIIARSGHGPNIPCVPVILLARKLAAGEAIAPGARPCLGEFTVAEFIGGMDGLDFTVIDELADNPGADD